MAPVFTIKVDVHFPADPSAESLHLLRRINTGVDYLHQLAQQSAVRERTMATTVADVKAQADKTLAAINDESSKDDAIILLVQGNTAMITSLKEQLAAAIAAGADPTALQAVLDSLVTAESSALANGAKVLAAVNAGTTA